MIDADSEHLSAAAYECCPPDYPRCSRNDSQTFSQLSAVGRHLLCGHNLYRGVLKPFQRQIVEKPRFVDTAHGSPVKRPCIDCIYDIQGASADLCQPRKQGEATADRVV